MMQQSARKEPIRSQFRCSPEWSKLRRPLTKLNQQLDDGNDDVDGNTDLGRGVACGTGDLVLPIGDDVVLVVLAISSALRGEIVTTPDCGVRHVGADGNVGAEEEPEDGGVEGDKGAFAEDRAQEAV